MRIGLVVEGKTDFETLRTVIEHRCPACMVTLIHPKVDESGQTSGATGWSGVQKYMQSKGWGLANLRKSGWHCIFIQVDADVAGGNCQEDASTQWSKAEAKLRQWAGLSQWPQGVYPVIAVMCLETWVGAATQGFKGRNPQMECLQCAQVVAQMPDEPEREAMRQKKSRFYKEHLAPRVATHWQQIILYCPVGAGRFEQVLQACGEEAA